MRYMLKYNMLQIVNECLSKFVPKTSIKDNRSDNNAHRIF